MQEEREGRGIAIHIFNHGARWWRVINTTPRLLYTLEGNPLPSLQEAGWATETMGTNVERKKFFTFSGFESRNASPYRLAISSTLLRVQKLRSTSVK
jgi:hypothetical protein